VGIDDSFGNINGDGWSDILKQKISLVILLILSLVANLVFIAHYFDYRSKFRVYRINGKSMNPLLYEGDRVLICSVLPENLTNYIVSFNWQRGKCEHSITNVLHRVISDNGTHILTKGDLNSRPDGWFSKKDVVGWMVYVL